MTTSPEYSTFSEFKSIKNPMTHRDRSPCTRSLLVFLLIAPMLACSRHDVQPEATVSPATSRHIAPAMSLPTVDGASALREVTDFVALGPRESGTPGTILAVDHIVKRLTAFGYKAVVDTFTNTTPRGRIMFRNVYAFKAGTSNRSLILASHFDTRSNISDTFSGANDSGSSTGLLLDLARLIHELPPTDIGIGFAFFDGEECMKDYSKDDGLHGSRRLATLLALEQPQPFGKPCALILMDMVGDQHLSVSIPGNTTPSLVTLILQAAHQEEVRSHFFLSSSHMIDDHVPFTQIGIPAVDLIDYEFGSAPGLNDYWHTDKDSIDKLSSESLAIMGRVVLRSIDLVRTSTL